MISGTKKTKQILLDFYTKKDLWKLNQVVKEHLLYYKENKDFESIYKLINKKIWLMINSADIFNRLVLRISLLVEILFLNRNQSKSISYYDKLIVKRNP